MKMYSRGTRPAIALAARGLYFIAFICLITLAKPANAQQHKRLGFYVDDHTPNELWFAQAKNLSPGDANAYGAKQLQPGDVLYIDQIISRQMTGEEQNGAPVRSGKAIVPPALSHQRIPIRKIDVNDLNSLKNYERNFIYQVIQTHNTQLTQQLTRQEENEIWIFITDHLWIYKKENRLMGTIDFSALPAVGLLHDIFGSSADNNRLELVIPTVMDPKLEALTHPAQNNNDKSNSVYYDPDQVRSNQRNFTYNAYSAVLNGANFAYTGLPTEEAEWTMYDWIHSGILRVKPGKAQWTEQYVIIKLKKPHGLLCHWWRYVVRSRVGDEQAINISYDPEYHVNRIDRWIRHRKRHSIYFETLKKIYPYQVKCIRKK